MKKITKEEKEKAIAMAAIAYGDLCEEYSEFASNFDEIIEKVGFPKGEDDYLSLKKYLRNGKSFLVTSPIFAASAANVYADRLQSIIYCFGEMGLVESKEPEKRVQASFKYSFGYDRKYIAGMLLAIYAPFYQVYSHLDPKRMVNIYKTSKNRKIREMNTFDAFDFKTSMAPVTFATDMMEMLFDRKGTRSTLVLTYEEILKYMKKNKFKKEEIIFACAFARYYYKKNIIPMIPAEIYDGDKSCVKTIIGENLDFINCSISDYFGLEINKNSFSTAVNEIDSLINSPGEKEKKSLFVKEIENDNLLPDDMRFEIKNYFNDIDMIDLLHLYNFKAFTKLFHTFLFFFDEKKVCLGTYESLSDAKLLKDCPKNASNYDDQTQEFEVDHNGNVSLKEIATGATVNVLENAVMLAENVFVDFIGGLFKKGSEIENCIVSADEYDVYPVINYFLSLEMIKIPFIEKGKINSLRSLF